MDQKTNVDKGITKEVCITEEFLDSVENSWSNYQENRKSAGSQQRNAENEDLGSGQMNIGRNYDLSDAPTVTKEEFLDSVENWWLNDQENRKSAGSQQRNTENEDLDSEHMNMGSKRKITEPEINPAAKRYKYLSHPNNNERAEVEHISPRPSRSADPGFSHESTEIQKDEDDMKIVCLCERTHTGETVFVCSLCAKRFHRYDNLKEHIESHRSKRSKFAKMNFTPHQG